VWPLQAALALTDGEAGVRHVLRLLERAGTVEKYNGERGDGRLIEVWVWKE
jgi:hypothetical protein